VSQVSVLTEAGSLWIGSVRRFALEQPNSQRTSQGMNMMSL
jgi:hypothetical protein